MGKRKRYDYSTSSESEEDSQKRIKRLKRKLRKLKKSKHRHRKRRYSSSSDSSTDREHRYRGYRSRERSEAGNVNERSRSRSSRSSSEKDYNNQGSESSHERPDRSQSRESYNNDYQTHSSRKATLEVEKDTSGVSKENPNDQETEVLENHQNSIRLDDDMLNAIGKRLTTDKTLADPVHTDLEIRWKEIYKNGLPKEVKTEIFQKYAQPKNCVFLDAPKLNPEVKASVQEPVVNRDSRLILKQEKVAVCLSALSLLLSTLLKKEEINKIQFIENLSDSCKILVDLQRDESITRKSLILANINTSLRDTLKETDIGELLFGDQLEEKLKAAKLLEKSSNELKSTSKSVQKRNPKNLNGPLHQTNKSFVNPRWPKTRWGSGQSRQYTQKGTQPYRQHQQPHYKTRTQPYNPRIKKE